MWTFHCMPSFYWVWCVEHVIRLVDSNTTWNWKRRVIAVGSLLLIKLGNSLFESLLRLEIN